MVAQIQGFVTRADANLRKPRSISRNISPANGGSAGHYWGDAQGLLPNHNWCIRKWRDGQNFHMDTRGWADIAYTGGSCLHGYAFAGRGFGIRTAANGSSFGNQNYYAFVALLGGNERPNELLLNSLDWWFNQARVHGGAGRRVRRHFDFSGTICPGPHLPSFLNSRDNKDIPTGVILPDPEPEPDPIVDLPIVGDWTGKGVDRIGVVRGRRFLLKNNLSGGPADIEFNYGIADDTPLVGNWTGNGVGVAVHRDGYFYINNSLGPGSADHAFRFGRPGDIPLVGDWNGDGKDTVGVYRDGYFHLRNELRGGEADHSFRFGARSGDIPLVGDWNGNGRDTVGVYRDGNFHLKNELRGGEADVSFRYGSTSGDVPLVGDWNGDGQDTVGIRRGKEFHLRNELRGGAADISFSYGR